MTSQRDSRIALVTGGGTGIGAATARMLGQQVKHVVVASPHQAELDSVCEEVRAKGGLASAEVLDVTDETAVKNLIENLQEQFGRIDAVVNSAGIFEATSLFNTQRATVQKIFDVNFMGSFNVMNHVLPLMRAQGGGAIVNFASVAGVIGQGGDAAYAASKAATLHYTRTICAELGGTGIRVNCIAPGGVRTPMTAFVCEPTSPEMAALRDRLDAESPSPWGTAFCEPEDIASIALFLLSDAARAIQGACILADQGQSSALSTVK